MTPAPNIRPYDQPHSDCWKQSWPLTAHQHRPGDVRRCPHGKVQVLTQVGPNARVAGPGTDWWRDLSRFWDRREYRLATAALQTPPTTPRQARPKYTKWDRK